MQNNNNKKTNLPPPTIFFFGGGGSTKVPKTSCYPAQWGQNLNLFIPACKNKMRAGLRYILILYYTRLSQKEGSKKGHYCWSPLSRMHPSSCYTEWKMFAFGAGSKLSFCSIITTVIITAEIRQERLLFFPCSLTSTKSGHWDPSYGYLDQGPKQDSCVCVSQNEVTWQFSVVGYMDIRA